MEVSCKKAAGKSICAFPDVCFTPPQTPATPPGVPIPYPNTGMASDTTDGSSSVKISGQEVMLKNKSYFKKSMGDEAGCAPKKGVVTSKNMGKVYFTMWSMDVKVEGENVVRHLDLTTHNHGSNGNSPPWTHTDEMAALFDSGVCAGKEHLRLARYSDGCPGGGTPHHLIPDRCATGSAGYSHGAAPCICVQGKNQHTGSHRACHRIFDPIERYYNSTPGLRFDYKTARYAAAASAGGAINPPRPLDEGEKACVEAQLDQYYQKDPKGPKIGNSDPMTTQGARGKVNELYDDVVAIFES
jgi:hypothetical protein